MNNTNLITMEKKAPNNKSKRGFASMPKDKVEMIAKKGGAARAAQLGHEGYALMGKKGGQASHGGGRKKTRH